MPASYRDVRMRGFAKRSTVEEACAWVDVNTRTLPAESLTLEQVTGRILAEDVVSQLDVPAFDRAAMDGFAVRAAETVGASEYQPLPFQVVGDARPGAPAEVSLQPGQAIRIMTGAPIPQGADAVVPAEYAADSGDRVELTLPMSSRQHIGTQGEDVRIGQVIVPAGRRLRPQDVGAIAAVGIPAVRVIDRPRVRMLITGNELVPPGTPRGLHQIYEANSFLLRGLISRDLGELSEVIQLADDPAAIRAALIAPGADVILISGGSSVGAEDHAPGLVAELGQLAIHGVAMRPSSPAGMGTIGSTLVFLLPGNPVSCLCAYDFFAGRALRQLAGLPADWPHRCVRAALTRKISSSIGRVDYCRVKLTSEGVEPLALSGASILSSAVRADGFVIIPAESEGAAEGMDVDVLLY